MRKYFPFLFVVLFVNSVFADSPITSTPFYSSYMNIPMIARVSKSNGVLNDELFDYLNSNSNGIGEKLAAINALKFNIHGKKNAEKYLKKLFLINQGYTYKSFYNKGTAQELILYGYLKAMDNYFDVKEALAFSNRAAKLNPNSYAIAIINQLIKVQTLSQNKWCEVYRLMNKIRDNKKMTNDFRKEASDIIFKYTDIYKTDCSN